MAKNNHNVTNVETHEYQCVVVNVQSNSITVIQESHKKNKSA